MKHSEAAAGAAHFRDGSATTPMPAVLLVEDDPTTLAYLQAITEGLPIRVETATDVSGALAMARARRYALLLVDANLPDGTGASLLRRLREQGVPAPALAHTASDTPAVHDALRAAGFADVLVKPIAAGPWREAIARYLPCDGAASPAPDAHRAHAIEPLWDEAAAAAALGGQHANVAGLRRLFLAELPGQLEVLRGSDADARGAQLHRLRASCAFVGAARLHAAVQRLHEAPACEERLRQVLDTAAASVAAASAP